MLTRADPQDASAQKANPGPTILTIPGKRDQKLWAADARVGRMVIHVDREGQCVGD